ncbi:MAG: hypothetical protein QM529_05025 [Hydrotalea sp.]|nr:hypothetical protein [Hydrotalea sp.]
MKKRHIKALARIDKILIAVFFTALVIPFNIRVDIMTTCALATSLIYGMMYGLEWRIPDSHKFFDKGKGMSCLLHIAIVYTIVAGVIYIIETQLLKYNDVILNIPMTFAFLLVTNFMEKK